MRLALVLLLTLAMPAAAAPARKPARHTTLTHTLRALLPPSVRATKAAPGQPQTERAYIGSFTNVAGLPSTPLSDHGEGLYVTEFDPHAGTLSAPRLVARTPSPAAFVIDPAHGMLYAANAYHGFTDARRPAGVGTVSAFRMDPQSGDLAPAGQSSAGGVPGAIALDPTGHYVVVANESALAALPLHADGTLGDYADINSADPASRFTAITFDRGGKYALVADSGTGMVREFTLDAATGRFTTVATFAQAAPHALAFSTKGDVLYVLSEDSKITVSHFDPATGKITIKQTLSALPPHYAGKSIGTRLLLSPNGNHLYALNGLRDSIATFAVARDGALKYAGETPGGGALVTSAAIDPQGRHLFVPARRADAVNLFQLDGRGNLPQPLDASIAAPSPAAMEFVPK